MGTGERALRWLLLLLLLAASPLGLAQQSENQVKAAFLFNFASYVEWPIDALPAQEAAFVVGFLDANAVAQDFRALTRDKQIHGRDVELRRVVRAADLRGLQMLYVGGNAVARRERLLGAALGLNVLTVTEDGELHPLNSVINFDTVDRRVRFDISMQAAEAGGLSVSSRLLNVARRVLR